MKKLNLIEWLWKTDSHEKQKPQRFVRYAAMLIMLLTLGVGQMWAQCSQGQIFYFKPSTSNPDWTTDARFAVCFQDVYGNSGYESWYSCIQVPGDASTYYAVAPAACYKWFFCRMQGSDSNNNWSNPPKWNQSTQLSWDGTNHYNLFTKKSDGNWDGDCNWGKYAPPMSSATLSNTSTIYGGDGTSGNPYKIKKGTTLSVSASATPAVDGGYTKYYQFYKKEGAGARSTWGSRTTTSTASVTASSTVGVRYEIDVVAQNEYYSTYGTGATSSTMYFITVDPIYAILGDFNSWDRSAATWDLSDQGSNNWDATFNLSRGDYNFKVVFNSVHYGNGATITRASSSTTDLSSSGNDMTITADLKGQYTFRYNSSGQTLAVTYPTRRLVSYSIVTVGGGTGTAGSLTATNDDDGNVNISTLSNYVADGNRVTFTAPSESTGYTFRGWYSTSTPSAADWSSGRLSTNKTYSGVSVSGGNKTVYAVYSQDEYAVTIVATNGSSPTSPQTIKQVTGTSLTATADTNYVFTGWSYTGGGIALKSPSTATNNPATFTATSTGGTITANFADQWNVKGSGTELGAWETYNGMPATGVANTFSKTFTLPAKTTYNFKIVKRAAPGGSDVWYGVDGGKTLTRASNSVTGLEATGGESEYITFTTDAAGDYTITYLYNASAGSMKVTVGYPTAYTMTFAPKTFLNGSSTGTTSTTGGTLTAKDQTNASLSTGDKVKDGGTATFTATKKTGYTFNGFFKNEVCTTAYAAGSGVVISDNVMTLDIDADKSVYAKFSENMTTVNLVASPTGKGTFTSGGGAVTSVSAGVTTHPTVTAVPASGYRVNTSATVWSKSSDYITISATNAAATTITGSGTSGNSATLTATFTPNNYTITLNDNEGSGGVGSATVTFDDDNFAFASSFVAPTRTGYIFQGYYTNGTVGYGDQIINKDGEWIDGAGSNYYIDGEGNWVYAGDKTIYAQWSPITFTIHYDANGGSGSMDDQVAKYEVESSLDGQNSFIDVNRFTAPTGYGTYYPAHPWNTSADGTGTDIDATTYQSTLTSTNGATVNLYAQWSGRFDLEANYDGGVDGYFRVHYNTAIIEAKTTLYPTRLGYLCDGYYTADEDGTKVLNGDGTVVEGNVSGYVTGGKWTYKGTQDFYAHWNQIKYNLAFDGNDCAAYVGEATGSKASMANVEYETYVDITAGTLAREGYTFAGWSKTPCATTASYVGDTWHHISSTDGDNVTLYAVWNAKNYTISFNALGGDCYTTSKSVAMGANYGSLPTAYGKSGYEFVGWYTRPEGGTLVTEETQMVTASDHTLYAHYEKKERVYFKNTLGWESVYVTWDAEWNHGDKDKGAGASGKTQELMSHIYGTDIWYKDIPSSILSSWAYNIAFTSESMSNYEWFDLGEAVFRRDFDKNTTMFVPVPNDPNKFTKNEHDDKPGTVYYSTDQIVDKDGSGNPTNYRYKNGYWVKYEELQAGYTLKGSWDYSWSKDHYIERSSTSDSVYIYTIKGLAANTTYYFKLWKLIVDGGNETSSVFSTSTRPITSATAADAAIFTASEGTTDAQLLTSVAGDYVFKFNFSETGVVKLTVEYPFAVNDYRVVYGYTKGSAQTFSSEYIKAEANAVDTISMFIHSADSATARSLYIQKCTDINASGVPTWNTTYRAITLPSETASGKTSGVYNFKITQDGSKAATGVSIGKYEGEYYIRCEATDGGWDQYKYRADNLMTFSEYSLSQTLSAPFSHYYCKYVGSSSTDITYTIATDYSPMICPILVGDATIGGVGNKTLPSGNPASIRFTWNQETNATFRSYLKSAQGEGNKRFLVLHGSDNKVLDADGNEIAAAGAGAEDMHANELLFSDPENWVYELAFKAKPGAKVSIIARYNGSDRYLVGGVDSYEKIIDGETSTTKYNIAAVYDFKTNRLITTWIPDGTISEDITEVDVMIERQYQGGGTTITFGKASEEAKAGTISAKRVIGALKFDYNDLVGKVANWTPDTRAKMMFFLSFPFDVNVSDIFGLNSSYGQAFIVQKYNGALRAEKGFFLGDGTTSFWEILPVDSVMHANVGYVVTMDNDYLNGDVGHVWDNKKLGDHVYLYFPSANDPEEPIVISSDPKTIKIPAHECKIDRTFGKLNHKYTDSNWNLMGVPIFQNHTGNATEGTPGAIFTASEEPSDTTDYKEHPDLGYFYQWGTDKNYTIRSAVGFTFLPMHSYMVQYAGDVKFTCAEPSVVPASVAPRRTPMTENYNIELQVLNSNNEMLNHTYVELRENAVDTFAVNEDTYMMSNSKAVNVYTFAGAYDVAANVLSIDSHVVPVGVIVNQAGTYTFSMPSNFSGNVTLVDNVTGIHTNLALSDYTVDLTTGTNDNRFYLEIDINKTPTSIDVIEEGGSLKDGKAHKFIENGLMYIIRDGVVFDAQGNRVQ